MLFHNYYVEKLSNNDIPKFINLQLQEEPEFASKIIDSTLTDHKKIRHIKSFLKNPLLLSLYILTFQTNPSVPNKKYIFYRRVIHTLFTEHDSKTKFGYRREKLSGLNEEQSEEVLKRFSFLSFFEGVYDFEEDFIKDKFRVIKSKLNEIKFDNNKFIRDLILAVALWVEDSGYYSFAHRSLQEYYASLFVKDLNENQKERAYNVIVKGEGSFIQNEVFNFLSLCKEMDTVDYLKFLELPVLEEIAHKLDTGYQEHKFLIKKLMKFFFVSLKMSKLDNDASIFEIKKSEKLIRKLFFLDSISEFIEKFEGHLFRLFHRDDIYDIMISKASYDHELGVYILDFSKVEIPESLLKKLEMDKDLKLVSAKFRLSIFTKKDEVQDYIRNKLKSNDEFIDMI